MSIIGNIVLFAFLGLLAAVGARRSRNTVLIYVCLCIVITFVEAWGSGFSLAYFSWAILVIVCLFYWLPFWFVLWTARSAGRNI